MPPRPIAMTGLPVYIGKDMYQGTYVRKGEGDCRCTPSEVKAMLDELRKDKYIW